MVRMVRVTLGAAEARRAHAIVMAALECDPETRSTFVQNACGANGRLRDEVRSLLAAHARAADFLETPVVETGDDTIDLVGATLGGFRIRDEIGSGGMGWVFRAEQLEPRRIVALKVLRAGVESASTRRRFVHEASILARLRHPGIAQVYATGVHAEGRIQLPYFAMEYVDGALPIDAHVASLAGASPLPVRGARNERVIVELLLRVCDAVRHGHQKGVIHRDLKPANILVDRAGAPKIIDFGVARLVADEAGDTDVQTRAGDVIGTPRYMSPEQCAADPDAIDVRTDVYALGTVLYELLCGRPPIDVDGVCLAEAARRIRDIAPRRPHLRNDLATIVLTALEKDPARRYPSVGALKDDLERFLRSEPIAARPPSLAHRARLFARRNRLLVACAMAIATTLAASTIVSAHLALRAHRALARAEWESYVGNIAAAEAAREEGAYQRMRTRLAGAAEEHRGWEWSYLERQAFPSAMVLEGHTHRASDVVFDPTDRLIYSGAQDGTIRTWDAASGSERSSVAAHTGRGVHRLALSSDGTWLASGGLDGAVHLWRARTMERVRTYSRPGRSDAVFSLAISPDGAIVACGDDRGDVWLWRRATGELVRHWHAHGRRVRAVVFVPSAVDTGWDVLTSGLDGSVRRWPGNGGPPRFDVRVAAKFARGVDVAGDRFCVAAAGEVQLRNLADGALVQTLAGHRTTVWGVRFLDGGRRLASTGGDHTLRIWNVETGACERVLGGHTEVVGAVAVDAAGTRLASASWDGTIRLWNLDLDERWDRLQCGDNVRAIAFSPRGDRLVTVDRDGWTRVYDTQSMDLVATHEGEGGGVRDVAFAPDGTVLATGGDGGAIHLRDPRNGSTQRVLPIADTDILSIAFSPGGGRLVAGGAGGFLGIVDVASGELVRTLPAGTDLAYAVDWSSDGSRIAEAGWDGIVRLWDGATYDAVSQVNGHDDAVHAAAFSPDGRLLVTGGRDQLIAFWDARDGALIDALRGHGQFVTALAFTPDGSRLASTSWFLETKIWSVARREELLTLPGGHVQPIRTAAFSADGSRLATGSSDGVVRFWDTARR